MYMLKKEALKSLLTSWATKARVYTPQIEDGQVMLLPYEEDKLTMNYVNFAFPVKEYLFKQREILFSWSNCNGSVNVEIPNKAAEKTIFFGIRPCDAYGIKYMDKFFLEAYRDEYYGRNRDEAVIIAVNCTEPGENCFCSSMSTGPFADSGYDLLFTPLKDGYLIEAGTKAGEELCSASKDILAEVDEKSLEDKEAAKQAALNKFKSKLDSENIGLLLEKNFDNPIWKQLSKECISCTGCTNVCPTCTCFNVVEEAMGDNCGCRTRYWDSCQNDSFTRNAKEHNPRSSEARFRYRIYDKFKYIEERFGMKGCTGCGRCNQVCPASIKLAEVINKLAANNLNVKGNGGD